jgi:hypothetical protein
LFTGGFLYIWDDGIHLQTRLEDEKQCILVNTGKVATLRSSLRWCSDGLEFTCWNGEVVRCLCARLSRPRGNRLDRNDGRHLG